MLLVPLELQGKSISRFLGHSQMRKELVPGKRWGGESGNGDEKGSVMIYGYFISSVWWKYSLFLQFSRWLLQRYPIWFFLWNFQKGCAIEDGWYVISWNFKGIANKIPQSWSPSAKNWRKKLYFQYIVDIKQPDTMTAPRKKHQPFFSRLCRQLYNLLKLFNCF